MADDRIGAGKCGSVGAMSEVGLAAHEIAASGAAEVAGTDGTR